MSLLRDAIFSSVASGKRNFDGLAAQLDRELVLDRRDQDRFPALPERLAQRPEPAPDGRVIPERVEVFEEEERGPIGRGFIDRFERGERVSASVRRVFSAERRKPGADIPRDQLPAGIRGEGQNFALDARFFRRPDQDQRSFRADLDIEFGDKSHVRNYTVRGRGAILNRGGREFRL